MPRKGNSAKQRIKDFLLEHVGEVVTSAQLQEVAAPTVEWARRLRELRTQEGWDIRSHHDDDTLRQDQYRLAALPNEDAPHVPHPNISARLRAQVFNRDGFTCQICGRAAGDDDELNPGRRVRLTAGHIVDEIHGGEATLMNLRAECTTCNEGVRDLAPEPPSWGPLMSQVRRARRDHQIEVLRWLKQKFEPEAAGE